MSGYQRKELQILGGGFNLLPPGDKVPSTDYLLAQNWRVDQAGKLVSRYGYPLKFQIAGPALAHSAAIAGGVESPWYMGANRAADAAVYYNFGGAPIATGFAQDRIGFVPMNGWMWAANQGEQGKHNAIYGWKPWTLAAPATACSGAGGAGVTSTVTTKTYTYALQGDPTYVHSLTIAGETYAFAENGYSAAQIPLVIASMASRDPNCVVTYSGMDVTVTPAVSGVIIPVSASDGGAAANLAINYTAPITYPDGTYRFYVTFGADEEESNPGPGSAAVAAVNQQVDLTGIPTSADSRVRVRNIYASGGTLPKAYLVGTLNDNTTTTFSVSAPDATAVNQGIVMPTMNDPMPAVAGIVGPYFNCAVGFNTAANPNRLFVSKPGQPQYVPGSANPSEGRWVDVGMDGEGIIWCTCHTNVLVIYKERSIWRLVGDYDSGRLEQVTDEIGLARALALAPAGDVDYFVGPNGLYVFAVPDRLLEITGPLAPLFKQNHANAGALDTPGSIQTGPNWAATALDCYYMALGYAMGKLYVSYVENAAGAQAVTLVYSEADKRWMYHRTLASSQLWAGFVFDGVNMVGLGGGAGPAAVGYSLDDFRGYYGADADPAAGAGTAIECVYQSHYEDCGLPDNQKVWLELVIDYEFGAGVIGFDVHVGLDAGTRPLVRVGTIATPGRRSASFALAIDAATGLVTAKDPASTTQKDVLARSLSVAIDGFTRGLLTIHNVYLYYYVEARLALAATTIPFDLGSGKVKQVKELELDIDASGGAVNGTVASDLPGNQIAVRQSPVVAPNGGRAVMKYPFPVVEGFLWRVGLTATAGAFRLYKARLLARIVGVYVEAYEAANGFVWDSMEQNFDSGITKIPRQYQIALAALPIKRFRELSLEIDTFGADVTLSFLTDLPGDAQAVQFTTTINSGAGGRRFLRVPLPAGVNPPIEGRMCRLQLSGASKFILYDAAVELLSVGVYVEAYEAAGGAVYDSRELDFGTPNVKEARELELDIESSGALTASVLSDISTTFALRLAATTGRQKLLLPLNTSVALEQFCEGRLLQLIVTGASAFRLYGARMRVRPFGFYLTAAEASGGALYDSTDIDLGGQNVKQVREIELDLWAYGAYTVTVYTDLPGNTMTARVVSQQQGTNGRAKVRIPLPQGAVPDNYTFGRLLRATVTSAAALKLFGGRIHFRPIGVYVEGYEAAAGAVWDSTPSDLGSPAAKAFDQVRFEMDSDAAVAVQVYTDLPGESFALRGSYALTNTGTSRHWATVPLPAGTEGRSIRLVVLSAGAFRIYKAQVRAFKIGRYLAAPGAAGQDGLATLEFDFASERTKVFKRIEVDLRADGPLPLTVATDQSGQLRAQYSPQVATPNGRETVVMTLPPGIRGKLLRIGLVGAYAARIYHIRVWARILNEAGAQWGWVNYPLEESDALPQWSELAVEATPAEFQWAELPVPATPPQWEWAPVPVALTEPQWFWARFLSVEQTSDTWEWVDVPFEVVS